MYIFQNAFIVGDYLYDEHLAGYAREVEAAHHLKEGLVALFCFLGTMSRLSV